MLCHIGDGIIFGVSGNGVCRVLSSPENGEEPNQTFFLSGPDAAKHLRRRKVEPEECGALLLCSDGAGVSLWNRETGTCAPAVKIMTGWVREEAQDEVSTCIEKQLDQLFRNNTPDDMSIAVLVPE